MVQLWLNKKWQVVYLELFNIYKNYIILNFMEFFKYFTSFKIIILKKIKVKKRSIL
jgi:hypothetical protein